MRTGHPGLRHEGCKIELPGRNPALTHRATVLEGRDS
jgi:hypothetical protein